MNVNTSLEGSSELLIAEQIDAFTTDGSIKNLLLSNSQIVQDAITLASVKSKPVKTLEELKEALEDLSNWDSPAPNSPQELEQIRSLMKELEQLQKQQKADLN